MRPFIFGLFALLTLWLTFHLHSKTGYFTYKSEIYSDKAGYYSYLPATFIFGFDGRQVADTLPEAIGRGFTVDDQGHIVTKYPIGVAILQAPFFLATHYVVAPILGYPADGFSPPYHRMIDVAAWVYLLLGMVLMARVLGEYFQKTIVWAALGCFFVGTNLCYYYAVESGMSHIYSFFLVVALLRLTQILHRRGKVDGWLGIGLGAVAGLLVVTRFTNALLLLIPLLWDIDSMAMLRSRIQTLLRPGAVALMCLTPMLLVGLQLTYYYYLSGSLFLYSYNQEGFDFLHPQVIHYWFAVHNSLFLYAPMMLFALVGLGMMVRHRVAGGWLGLGLFLGASLIFASWHDWGFGCAFGARSLVEFYPIFVVAFGYFLQWLGKRPLYWKIGTWSLLVVLCAMNFRNSYNYKLCYFGHGDWDWAWWWDLVGTV